MAYSKIILNDEVLMDVTNDTVEANKLLTGETATAANGQKVTGTLVTSNDFVITLEPNQSNVLEPDCTFTEAVAAYNGGKNIVFTFNQAPIVGGYVPDQNCFQYAAIVPDQDGHGTDELLCINYTWTNSGVTASEGITYYDLANSQATAEPSNVLYGAEFFNRRGFQVGTIQTKTSTNVTVFDATVHIPSGYYAEDVQKTVALGTAGTPTATKGTVSNHSVSVTPSVTNTTGYITGSTKTGTAVTVSASELVSGTKSITENGTGIDVTNYASVDVNVPNQGKYTATIINNYSGTSIITYVKYNNTTYYQNGATFNYNYEDICTLITSGIRAGAAIYIDNVKIKDSGQDSSVNYEYTLPNCDIIIELDTGTSSKISITTLSIKPLSITTNGIYTAPTGGGYSPIQVNIPIPDVSFSIQNDGKTHLWYLITNTTIGNTITINLGQSNTILDWGDGTIINNPSRDKYSHTYTEPGIYHIILDGYLGTFQSQVSKQEKKQLVFFELGSDKTGASGLLNECIGLTFAYFADDSLGSKTGEYSAYAELADCSSLDSCRLDSNMTVLSGNFFSRCSSLRTIILPEHLITIYGAVFQGCSSLENIILPETLQSIGNGAFSNCSSLTTITIPKNVTTIGSQAFYYCTKITEYHLLPITPPTLVNTNAFYNINSNCIIYVPYSTNHSILESYQTATNWSTYASYMQEESV